MSALPWPELLEDAPAVDVELPLTDSRDPISRWFDELIAARGFSGSMLAFAPNPRCLGPLLSSLKTAAEADKIETAAWYGRGEKPKEPVELGCYLDYCRAREARKPTFAASAGLATIASDTRYQGLGFNDTSFRQLSPPGGRP